LATKDVVELGLPRAPPHLPQPSVFPPHTPLARWREPIPGLPEEAWPDMVTIPAGEFLMGAPDTEEGSNNDERPQRFVTIPRPFALGRTAVTVKMWFWAVKQGFKPLVGTAWNVPSQSSDQMPVTEINHDDAIEYCPKVKLNLTLDFFEYLELQCSLTQKIDENIKKNKRFIELNQTHCALYVEENNFLQGIKNKLDSSKTYLFK
jgi:hypothetical protein